MMQIVIVEKDNSNANERARAHITAVYPRIVCVKREDGSGLFDIRPKTALVSGNGMATCLLGTVIRIPPPAIGGVPLIPQVGDFVTLGTDRFFRVVVREFTPQYVGILAETSEECLRLICDDGERRIVPASAADLPRG